MARVTLQTIADQLGVSRMTVSNAFSRPDQLSGELRARILDAAHELGYVGPNPTARALARGTTGAVGVLLTDSLQLAFTDEVAIGFLGGIVEGLSPTGLALTLLTSDGRDDIVPARDVAIDGAVIYSCYVESAARDWLLRRRMPLVFVDQDPMPGIPSVNVDDRGGAKAAAQHVVDLGHRRVGILNAVADGPTGLVHAALAATRSHPPKQRLLGWLDALKSAGIEPSVAQTRAKTPDDIEDALELLAGTPRPTVVLCFSDVLALGVIRAARSIGLAVPDDLSVVGFDDSPSAHHSDPSLTTVRQDVGAKGRLAAITLTETIEQTRSGPPARARHRILPTELVIRGSTTHPPRRR